LQDTNTLDEFKKDLLAQMRPISWAFVVFTSALTGQRLSKVLDAVTAAGEQHRCGLRCFVGRSSFRV